MFIFLLCTCKLQDCCGWYLYLIHTGIIFYLNVKFVFLFISALPIELLAAECSCSHIFISLSNGYLILKSTPIAVIYSISVLFNTFISDLDKRIKCTLSKFAGWINGLRPAVPSSTTPDVGSCSWVTTIPFRTIGLGMSAWRAVWQKRTWKCWSMTAELTCLVCGHLEFPLASHGVIIHEDLSCIFIR